MAGRGTKRLKKKRAKVMIMVKKNTELKTKFSYNPLWHLLIDRGIKKQELQKMSDVSAASIAKMGRCENVTMDVLLRICEALDCQLSDIVERVPRKIEEK